MMAGFIFRLHRPQLQQVVHGIHQAGGPPPLICQPRHITVPGKHGMKMHPAIIDVGLSRTQGMTFCLSGCICLDQPPAELVPGTLEQPSPPSTCPA